MNDRIRILAVDDEENSLENIRLAVKSMGYEIICVNTAEEAISLLLNEKFNLAIVDLKLPGSSGLEVIEKTRISKTLLKYLLITGYSEEESILKAIKLGVEDILKKPYDESELYSTVNKILKNQQTELENIKLKERLEKENQILSSQLSQETGVDQVDLMVGESNDFLLILENAKKAASVPVNILISGESGTGKELLANYIYRNGVRNNKPFVPVNCPALSASLFESELFGYTKGSYTGAGNSQAGLFEIADKGILFLDEITEIPIELQAKLLRSVENRTVKRLGSTEEIRIDVQIISTTNRNIHDAIEYNLFRSDLFHRLSNVELHLPPLRERMDDFELLLEHFIKKFSKKFKTSPKKLSDKELKILKQYDWPGNIRQLSNFAQKWVLFPNSGTPIELLLDFSKINSVNGKYKYHFHDLNMTELEDAKKWLVQKVLNSYGGNKTKTAEHLGLSYQGLLKMLKNYGIGK